MSEKACKKCSKPLEKDWVACPWCGTSVLAPAKPKRSRPNGAGYVYKRGRTWTACVTVGVSRSGNKVKQARRTKGGFLTKSEALKYCAVLASAPAPKRVPSLSEYYDTFYGGKMESLSDSKRTAYTIAWNKLTTLKDRPIDTLTIAELQKIVIEKCPTFYPARDMKSLLNHLYKLAAVDGNANPTLPDLIELPKLEEGTREPFTEDEQKQLWAAYERGEQAAAIPLIMIYTGMMTGEMRKLAVSMIDLQAKEIVGVGIKTNTRKKESVLLPDAILPVIENELSRVDTELLYPVSEMDFYGLYYGALEHAGIKRHLTPYSCRHTAATALAIDENIAPQTVKRLMRWSSTKMMDRYVHPSDDDARAAINRRKKGL